MVEILPQGIVRTLYHQGAGAGRPLVDNNTDAGRPLNCWVELGRNPQIDQALAQRIAAERCAISLIYPVWHLGGGGQSKSSVPLIK